MIIRKIFLMTFMIILSVTFAGFVQGEITLEEANKLGTTLTGFGAEKDGNKEGTIPPYTGGLTTPPQNFTPGSATRPDPFADEKPLFSISLQNMDQYADKLSDGTKAMMRRYPSFRIDVYKTHRTVAYPKWVLENTAKNALTAKTTNGGVSMTGAHASILFPIPKDGYEVMWNHLTRFCGFSVSSGFRVINVDRNGIPTVACAGQAFYEYPYWNNSIKKSDLYFMYQVTYTGPARISGQRVMYKDPLDTAEKGRSAWQYLPGQRRVKLAPEFTFDTPDPGTAGVTVIDDCWNFNGSMERYDFKLLGKKEIYIPYNTYRLNYHVPSTDVATPKFLNPDLIRWELHRVWVVEGTLKPGKRHIYTKRVFYADEDSWFIIAKDQYDARGQLYRVGYLFMAPSYDVPSPQADTQVQYDLDSGQYCLNGYYAEDGGLKYIKPLPAAKWSPDALAGSGIR